MRWLARFRRQVTNQPKGKGVEETLPLWDWEPSSMPDGPIDLPSLTYSMAYMLMPTLAYQETETTLGQFLFEPKLAGSYFYARAVELYQQSAQWEHALTFHTHHGKFSPGRYYFILEYPAPPPLIPGAPIKVLAPYFSVIVQHISPQTLGYYVLGQRAARSKDLDEGEPLTTLRAVTEAGINRNLGRGSAPELEALLQCLRARTDL
jgi:hypothetical protein